jgi:hypothetical protein
LRRFRVIEGAGDLYDVFERIAVPLGIDVRTDVFLSYSRSDLAKAEALTQALLDRGRRPWVDRRDLQPSEDASPCGLRLRRSRPVSQADI